MFLFTNKKVIVIWTFEVSCIKEMEKSEIIKKRCIENIGWYFKSLVIDITFICFWGALIALLSI